MNRLSMERTLSNVVVRRLRNKSFVSESELLENLLDKVPDRIYFKDLKSRFIQTISSAGRTTI